MLSCSVVQEIQPPSQRIMQHVVTPEFPANGHKQGRYPSRGGCYESSPTATAGLCHPAWRTSLSAAHRVQRGLSEMKHLSSAAGAEVLAPPCEVHTLEIYEI